MCRAAEGRDDSRDRDITAGILSLGRCIYKGEAKVYGSRMDRQLSAADGYD